MLLQPSYTLQGRWLVSTQSDPGLTDAVRLKGLRKAKPPVGPGYVERVVVVGGLRDGLHVVVRVVTEVRNDIRGGVDPGRRPVPGAAQAGSADRPYRD